MGSPGEDSVGTVYSFFEAWRAVGLREITRSAGHWQELHFFVMKQRATRTKTARPDRPSDRRMKFTLR
jgi:hypothetical protein